MKYTQLTLLSIMSVSLLTSCSGAKDKLGLKRKTPDEFAVIKRAPLEIPPDLRELPIPRKGAPRPQEETVQEQAQEALFGEETTMQEAPQQQSSASEDALLAKTGANEAEPNIRTIIDEEAERYTEENQAVIDKLLKRKTEVPGSTLDAREELERLKEEAVPSPNVPPPATPTAKK